MFWNFRGRKNSTQCRHSENLLWACTQKKNRGGKKSHAVSCKSPGDETLQSDLKQPHYLKHHTSNMETCYSSYLFLLIYNATTAGFHRVGSGWNSFSLWDHSLFSILGELPLYTVHGSCCCCGFVPSDLIAPAMTLSTSSSVTLLFAQQFSRR